MAIPVTSSAHPSPLFSRVIIVGVGLLGGSLGLALKERGLAGRVVGVGRKGSGSLDVALGMGAIDEAVTDVVAAVRGEGEGTLIVLCTPVRTIEGTLREMAGHLPVGTIVTDVGSTKERIMGWAKEILPAGVEFVGSHPMAGSEKRGPEAAWAGLYQGGMCLICEGSRGRGVKGSRGSPPHGVEGTRGEGDVAREGEAAVLAVEGMWRGVGMRTMRMEAGEHDRWVATISHLPHAAATCLVQTAGKRPEALAAIAGGFLDTTRVASGDVTMWTDIFLTNREAVGAVLRELEACLAGFREAVERGDEEAIRGHLRAAKDLRDGLVDRRKGGV